MSASEVVNYVLLLVINFLVAIGAFASSWLLNNVSQRRNLLWLITGSSFSLAALYAYLLTSPGKWSTIREDHVPIQWEPWFVWIISAIFTGAAAGVYLSMRSVWVGITAVVAAFPVMFGLFATITSLHGNYVHFLFMIIAWVAVIGTNIAATQRNKDRYYWIVWSVIFLAPIFFAAGYLLGHAALRELTYNQEIWLYFIGVLFVFVFLPIFMAFTYAGGGFAEDIKRRFHTKSSASSMDASSSSSSPTFVSSGYGGGNVRFRGDRRQD